MFKQSLTFFFLFVFSLSTLAQSKKFLKAKANYDAQDYLTAIDQLEKIVEEDEGAYEPLKYLANSYRKIRIYTKAEEYFYKVVNSSSAQPEDYLYYGQILKKNGKLAAAKEQFLKFSQSEGNSFIGNLMVQSFNELEEWDRLPKDTKVENDRRFNSHMSENNLQQFNNKYYITSNREKDYVSPEAFGWDGTPYFSIYEIDTNLLGSAKEKFQIVNGKMNTQYNDGPLGISSDGKRAIITRVTELLGGKKFFNTMQLYEGTFDKGKWKKFKAVSFNSHKYSSGHATFGEHDSVIYFTSNKPGGYGGYDLYKSLRKGGKWGEPINLGPSINTTSNELFPTYYKNKLYYSSDGFSGYGGLDVLVSEYNDGWQSPVNLKSPVNSSKDDFGMYFISDSIGYFASDRDGGEGKDDLYRFYKSSTPLSVGITGVFEYKGLPIEGTKILLVDENDSVVAVEYTDKEGRFAFRKLAYQENVFLKLDTEDPDLLEDGRLFQTNAMGEKIKLIERLKNGVFKFKALPAEEVELELLALQDKSSIPELVFGGKVFNKLPGDFNEEVKVYLVDDKGTVVDSVYTDKFGNFKFKKLNLDDNANYIVQFAEETDELNLAFVNESGRLLQAEQTADGEYRLVRDQTADINSGLIAVVARAELLGKPLRFARVDIYDEENNFITTVFTNGEGEFQYNKLKLDQSYLLRLPDLGKEDLLDTKFYLLGKEGDPLYLLNRLINGDFIFKALPLDENEKLQDLEESLVPQLVDLRGQVYKKLKGDFDEKLKVYLVDEKGLVVDSVYTDARGKFNFQKLESDQNYTFRVEEAKEFKLALLDKEDRIIEEAFINETGNFTYKKLTYQVATFEPLEAVDEGLIEDDGLTKEIYGQVFQNLPGDFDEGMEVYVYNQDGELVGTTYTDGKGKFKFKKLDADDTYYFRIEHSEVDFQLLTLDENANVVDRTVKNRLGFFKYKTLGVDKHEISLLEERDHHQILFFDDRKIDLDTFTVHYRFDSTLLNTQAKINLNRFLEVVKGQEFIVEVQSYTDIRGPRWYNEKLSKARTKEVVQYLLQNGVDKGRIVGLYFGELDPIVDCETKNCDNDDHAKNRRTELKLRLVNKEKQ